MPGEGLVKEDDTGEEPFIALGAEIDFGNWNLFGEYAVVGTDVSDLAIDIITFGVKYEFSNY